MELHIIHSCSLHTCFPFRKSFWIDVMHENLPTILEEVSYG